MTRSFWTVRRQLWGLFGVMLIAAGCVLGLDAFYQHDHEATLSRLYDNALGGQASVKALTDAYGIDIIGVTFKVRNGLMTFDQGIATVDQAQQRIQEAFAALQAESMPHRQRRLLADISRERVPADAAVAALRAQLVAHSIPGVGHFADTQMFPVLDPLLSDLGLMADLKILDAQRQLHDDHAHAQALNVWRICLSTIALLIVVVAGRRVLRNVYRGIEQLVRLSKSMRAGDYESPVGAPLKGETGEVVSGFLEMREEVKRKNAALRESETRAQEASRAKSAFLAAMSHEIRTPMIGITGMLELLEHTPLNAEQRRSVSIVQSSAESLLQIIGDILDFSKIEAGRMELAPQDIDLRRLVEHTVGNYLGIASSKGLTLEAALDEKLAPAYVADPLRLRQILSNFLSNAVKFTRTGGVTVQAERLATLADGRDRIALRVRDTGIGISDEQRGLLFQPFSQADSGTARNFGGTGLGLAICRQLAEMMGGTIELASKPGQGSAFSLTLPLAKGDPARIEREAVSEPAEDFPTRPLPSVEAARREKSLVLVVDDHSTNREVLTRQLARAGFACETAVDGEEGLRQWQTGAYALVLTDIHMPKLDGYQLTVAIRKAERRAQLPRTPIIAITANVSKGEPEHCLAMGMDGFLGKPMRIAQLSAALRRWLPHVVFPAQTVDSAPAGMVAPVPAADTDEASGSPHEENGVLAAPAAPVDLAALREIAGADQTLARNLLNDFLVATRKDIAALDAALADGNLPEATRHAHRIKGSAGLVGAQDVRTAAAEAEQAGRNSDAAALADKLHSLKAAVDILAVWTEG
jgi:signal transduction histidine kinase/HPt (histidine-containing phosphotransfer) domain-containing protein/ActR/RegA family two-component response regulator